MAASAATGGIVHIYIYMHISYILLHIYNTIETPVGKNLALGRWAQVASFSHQSSMARPPVSSGGQPINTAGSAATKKQTVQTLRHSLSPFSSHSFKNPQKNWVGPCFLCFFCVCLLCFPFFLNKKCVNTNKNSEALRLRLPGPGRCRACQSCRPQIPWDSPLMSFSAQD